MTLFRHPNPQARQNRLRVGLTVFIVLLAVILVGPHLLLLAGRLFGIPWPNARPLQPDFLLGVLFFALLCTLFFMRMIVPQREVSIHEAGLSRRLDGRRVFVPWHHVSEVNVVGPLSEPGATILLVRRRGRPVALEGLPDMEEVLRAVRRHLPNDLPVRELAAEERVRVSPLWRTAAPVAVLVTLVVLAFVLPDVPVALLFGGWLVFSGGYEYLLRRMVGSRARYRPEYIREPFPAFWLTVGALLVGVGVALLWAE
jgi:hypothetical protein